MCRLLSPSRTRMARTPCGDSPLEQHVTGSRSPEGFGVRASSRPARHALSPRVDWKRVTRRGERCFCLPFVTIATADETEMRKVLVSHLCLICLGGIVNLPKSEISG